MGVLGLGRGVSAGVSRTACLERDSRDMQQLLVQPDVSDDQRQRCCLDSDSDCDGNLSLGLSGFKAAHCVGHLRKRVGLIHDWREVTVVDERPKRL
jgi:hypothetical protein